MTSMDISSSVELYDSDFLAMERGPLAYARSRSGSMADIDQFVRDVTEQFAAIGLGVDVQVWITNQENTYEFRIEIRSRLDGKPYDFDRQVHEVVNNILELPGQEGWIKTSDALANHNRELWTPKGHKGCSH